MIHINTRGNWRMFHPLNQLQAKFICTHDAYKNKKLKTMYPLSFVTFFIITPYQPKDIFNAQILHVEGA